MQLQAYSPPPRKGARRRQQGLSPACSLLQKPVFIDLWLDLLGEALHGGAEIGEKRGVGFVGACRIHLRLALRIDCRALEMEANVVEGGVGVGIGLGMVVAPQPAASVKDGLCGGGEFFDRIYRINRIQEVAHEMRGEAVFRVHLGFRKRDPVVHAIC